MYVPVYSSVQYGIEKENNRSFIQRSPQFPMGIATKHTYEEEDSVGRLCASVPFLYQNTTITTYQKKKAADSPPSYHQTKIPALVFLG